VGKVLVERQPGSLRVAEQTGPEGEVMWKVAPPPAGGC